MLKQELAPRGVGIPGLQAGEDVKEQTLEQRCKVALDCLPDARYRTMLAELLDDLLVRAAVPAKGTATQRHITDMLVAHRDMIEAQQRGDSAAEVLAVQRMEAARSALADARPGEEQLEPFWCHEQSHDRPRCETQCAECAEDGVAEPSGEELSQAPSLDEILAVVLLYAKNPTPHNEYKVRCALRDALNLERQPQVRAMTARAWEERSRRDGARDD